MNYKRFIRFGNGKKGDITPLLKNKKAFKSAITEMAKPFFGEKIDKVVGIEARGFIFAGAIAYLLGVGLVLVRKSGSLPMAVLQEKCIDYTGKEKILEIHKDAIKSGERVLIIDDWFETGAQAKATIKMIKKLGGIIVGLSVFIDNTTPEAREFLSEYKYHYLVHI